MNAEKVKRLVERGYCPGPFHHSPTPSTIGLNYRAKCPVCLRWIAILQNGNFAVHKRRPLTKEEYAEAFACSVCPVRPARGYYMVTDEVWAAARLQPRQMACLQCLAERLGRPLRAADFTPAPVNREIVAVLEANEAAAKLDEEVAAFQALSPEEKRALGNRLRDEGRAKKFAKKIVKEIDHDPSSNNCGCSSCIELDYRRG